MPGPIVALWLILGGAGTALLGPPPVWSGVDPMVRSGGYRPEPVAYRAWTSSPTRDKTGCTFAVYALATRETVHRLRVDGVEQLVDWSWRVERRVALGDTFSVVFTFVDPVTRVEHRIVVYDQCWVLSE